MSEKKILKKWHVYFLSIVVVLFIVLKLFDWLYWPYAAVTVAGVQMDMTVASTPTHWHKGLSGKNSLAENEGMWFKFTSKTYHTIVMRDMEFAIDVVWLDGNTVIDIAPSIKPEKGLPEAELTLYRPRLPATAVLELPAGFTVLNKLKIGDTVEFPG